LPGNTAAFLLRSSLEAKNSAMAHDLERLKQRIPLLEYLQRFGAREK
jgi:hypothetical protein